MDCWVHLFVFLFSVGWLALEVLDVLVALNTGSVFLVS